MNPKPAIERFYDNMMIFSNVIEQLIIRLNNEGHTDIPSGLLGIAIAMLKGYDKTESIQKFIRNSHKHWSEILKKDDDLISENTMLIFTAVPTSYRENLHKCFKEKDKDGNLIITSAERESIWVFLHSLIRISIKYIHENQGAYSDKEGRKRYKKHYSDKEGVLEVDVTKASKDWNVQLPFA